MANSMLTQALDFRDATRQQAKASILIEGLTGKGKSGLALAIAYALAGKDWKKVYAIDTENKSLDLFEGIQMHTGDKITPFKKLDLLPSFGYQPSNYLIAKDNAVKAGGTVCINDSITHMWQREGGVLDIVAGVQKTVKNSYAAWGDPAVVAEKQAIYNTVRDNRIHVISTVRVKEKFEMVTTDGKTGLQALGEQEQQMPDLKYEPDLVLHMVKAGSTNGAAPVAHVVKSRYVILQEGVDYTFTEELIQQLVSYLDEGADPAELLEQQRQEYIRIIKETLDGDPSKQTMFPELKKQQGFGETKLVDLPLNVLQTLLGIMLS